MPKANIIPRSEWSNRKPRKGLKLVPELVTAISWHCQGAANGDPKYVDPYWPLQIIIWHMAKGWAFAAYNYIITPSGNIYEARGKSMRNGAEGKRSKPGRCRHVGQEWGKVYASNIKSINKQTVSVCFAEVGYNRKRKVYIQPTDQALAAGKRLARHLLSDSFYPNLRYNVGHNWHRDKDCPGEFLNQAIEAGYFGPIPIDVIEPAESTAKVLSGLAERYPDPDPVAPKVDIPNRDILDKFIKELQELINKLSKDYS